MRRTLLGLLAAVLVASGSTLVAAPAEAASAPVTIKELGVRWIGWKGTATVKPAVRKAADVTVMKERLTVRKGNRVLHRNRASVKLQRGWYQVTTKVTYKHEGEKRTITRTQRLAVKQGRCATKANYHSVKAKVAPGAGDKVRTVSKKVRSSGSYLSDFFGSSTLADWREIFEGDAEARQDIDQLINQYGEDAVFDGGSFDVCRSKKAVNVTFIDGHAVHKEVGSSL